MKLLQDLDATRAAERPFDPPDPIEAERVSSHPSTARPPLRASQTQKNAAGLSAFVEDAGARRGVVSTQGAPPRPARGVNDDQYHILGHLSTSFAAGMMSQYVIYRR